MPVFYDNNESDSGDEPEIPEILGAASTTTTVTGAECISHLKFLAALAQLRESVENEIGLFKIGGRDSYPDLLENAEIQQRVREKIWQVYVSRAVDRFTRWWMGVPRYNNPPTVMSLKAFDMDPLKLDDGIRVTLTREELPPLDVLMVWHTFMLNPRAYLEDCFRQARMNLWATPFPWDLINDCITCDDKNSYLYEPGKISRSTWRTQIGRKWDNVHDSLDYNLDCPLCHNKTKVPWTTAHITMLSPGRTHREDYIGFQSATGYADQSFEVLCSGCNTVLDHDYLPVLKFRKDNRALLKQELPMPGTLYNPNGVVKNQVKRRAKWSQLTPNYYLLNYRRELLKILNRKGKECRSVRDLADGIHSEVYKHNLKINALDMDAELCHRRMFHSSKGEGRGTLRRMMSRYWGNNSSIFALDLVGAVIRQGTFVQKMKKLNWLGLPSSEDLSALTHRFIEKYDIFWRIIVENPSQIVVPTLDVDLVWHTHQLDPKRYYTHSLTTTSRKKPVRFIDHNDRIDEGRISDSFAWTVKQYRKMTGGMVYSECFCWYCEATRSKGLFEKLSLSSEVSKNLEKLQQEDERRIDLEQTETAHISAHNAVRAIGKPAYGPVRRKKLDKFIKKHEKQEAEKQDSVKTKKNNNEKRNTICQVFESNPPLHLDAYVNHPSCINLGHNEAGNCISGSCTPSMAAGSCGGASFASGCAVARREHGNGFGYIQNTSGGGGGGGGAGCGGGC
ncbi:hypothetical protein BGW36DRAFT_308446 [Talaromyces proteolyticus]|uniref:Uncharacterized protein n=1 Tax=Talaromyces proteolyticus TaxID=1131652 RepID=A0AAD4KDS2_9EURO|nr:uncharacterized protein BGW36DRAFT_308446 [Talaromyces proteolyticus]KAH8689422.1 hypothetical protein BGW36DRAFT_308446 [Talaromyces proteolyticus]